MREPETLQCHPVAGVSFYAAEPSLWLPGDVRRWDDSGHHYSMGYGGMGLLAGVEATVYVYPETRSRREELTDALGQIMRARPEATIMADGDHAVAGMEGLWAHVEHANDREEEPQRVQSLTWIFSFDGWVVKYRCTNWNGLPHGDVEGGLRDLVAQLGAPDTSRRVASRRTQALARSRDAMQSLLEWLPIVDPLARAVQTRVHELTRHGLTAEAVTLLREQLQVLPPAGLNAELSRVHLVSGDLLQAVEMCMAEEEEQSGQTGPLEHALRYYTPDVRYGAGWGGHPQAAVAVAGPLTLGTALWAEHRFLEFVLGERGVEWALDIASIAIVDGDLYDVLRALLPSGDSVIFWFSRGVSLDRPVDDQVLGTFRTGGTVRGEPARLNEEGAAMPTSSMEVGQSDAIATDAVIEHLMTHSSITLALAGDEVL